MDFSKLKTADWLKIGGAAGMLIFGFFDWAKYDFMGISTSGNNVFNYPVRGLISWILVIGVGVVTLLGSQGKKVGNVQWPIVSVLATSLATILMLLLIILGPDDSGLDFKPAIGLWLAFISTVVALAGSVMSFQSGGGNLKDLTDVEKLKKGFGKN
jgi:nucleoside recognition membrane protein YjiH